MEWKQTVYFLKFLLIAKSWWIYILKIYSDDSDLKYYKSIKLIRETESTSTKQDISDIEDMINSESKEIQSDIDYIPSQYTNAKIKM